MAYRLHWDKSRLNIILEEFSPSTQKDDGTFTQDRWNTIGYYGKWSYAVGCVLNKEICPIGDDLEAQLADVPAAIERATQKIIESIRIVDENILIL